MDACLDFVEHSAGKRKGTTSLEAVPIRESVFQNRVILRLFRPGENRGLPESAKAML